MLGLNYCVGLLLDFSVTFCVFAHFVCLERAYVGPVIMVSREWHERGVFVVVPITFIVGVRHALFAPQSYDLRVHIL